MSLPNDLAAVHLKRVRHRSQRAITGVVIAGEAQEYYKRGYEDRSGVPLRGNVTVVNNAGNGHTCTLNRLWEVWELSEDQLPEGL